MARNTSTTRTNPPQHSAWQRGFNDAQDNLSPSANPYHTPRFRYLWAKGYIACRKPSAPPVDADTAPRPLPDPSRVLPYEEGTIP